MHKKVHTRSILELCFQRFRFCKTEGVIRGRRRSV